MRAFYIFLFGILTICQAAAQEATDEVALQEKYQEALEYISAYQFDAALELLTACHQANPSDKDYLLRMAYCSTQLGRYFDAKSHYNALLKLDSKNTQALSSIGSIYERENNYREALLFYQAFAKVDSTNSYVCKRCGLAALKLQQTPDAIAYFLQSRQLNPTDIEIIEQLSALAISAGQLNDAEKLLNEGLAIDGSNIRLLQIKARLHIKRKEYNLVAKALEKTLAQGDTSDFYQMLLAISYVQLDSIDKAIFHLEHLVSRKEDTEQTHEYLGFAYRKKGELELSQFHYEMAIKLGITEKIDAYYANLGETLEKQGKYRQAIEHYQKAYNYNPKAAYLFNIAYNHDLAYKDKRTAVKYYKQYLATKDKEHADYTQRRIEALKK